MREEVKIFHDDKEFCETVVENPGSIQPRQCDCAGNVLFSFIMPTYNRAFCIKRSISSLLHQETARPFELIVVDDGSTDNTESLVSMEFAKEIANGVIRYVKTANGGSCKARNLGLSQARGEWIAYLDSDNEIVPDFIETFAAAIESHPEADAFYSKLEFMGSHRVIGKPFDYESLRAHNFIDLGAYVHRRELCRSEGVFDEEMTRLVDWELILRYSKRHTPVFIDKTLLMYDDSKDTNRISNAGRESYFVNLNRIRRKHCADYPVVTTIITAYNHEKFIAQALESAIIQEGRFIHEILVSDDCSADGTRKIIREYATRNPDLVKDISSDFNLGISGNMRKCISMSTGKYIAVLEGDDYWTSGRKLATQVDFMEENPDCSMVFSRVKVQRDGKEQLLSRHENLPGKLTGKEFFNAETLSLLVNFSCCMFVADHLKNLPEFIYDNRLSEIALAFYLETKGYIGYIPDVMSVYRIHSAGEWSGASVIGKRLQERFCRVVARTVCRPQYRAGFDQRIAQIDREILKRENELLHKLDITKKKNAELEAKQKALSKKSAEADKKEAGFAAKLAAENGRRDKTIEQLRKDLGNCRRELEHFRREAAALANSESYQTGMVVTWPVRKLYRAVKSLYTKRQKHTTARTPGNGGIPGKKKK